MDGRGQIRHGVGEENRREREREKEPRVISVDELVKGNF